MTTLKKLLCPIKLLLFAVIGPLCVNAQIAEVVTGKITDEAHVPLQKVTIEVQGEGIFTTSDNQGKFSIKVKNPSASSLILSYVGFDRQEVKISGKSYLEILMKSSIVSMSDVVVVGFGTQKKENLTGAVSTIKADVFQDRPLQNATQALMGVSPGLNVGLNTGVLDAEPSINIRGITTISDGSNGTPLILIDGMPGNLSTLNPQSIESISVLKDAASASIYGSRAAFGVVLVTTKSGSKGDLKVNYSNSFRWNKPLRLPEMADSYSFAQFINDGDLYGDWFDPVWMARIKAYRDGDLKTPLYVNPVTGEYERIWYGANGNTDWYDALFRKTSNSQEHTVSASGGNEKVRMYAALNGMGMNGLMQYNQDKYKRLAADAKVDARVLNFIDLTYSTKFTRINYGRPTLLTDGPDGLFLNLARQGWPIFPLYDNKGNLMSDGWVGPKAVQLRDGGRSEKVTTNNAQQLQLKIEPVKNWEIIGKVNYLGVAIRGNENLQQVYSYDAHNQRYLTDMNQSYVWNSAFESDYIGYNLYSNYLFNLNRDHAFKVLAGVQTEEYNMSEFDANRQGIIVPGINVIDATTGLDPYGEKVPPTVGGRSHKWATAGYFGRLNYNYKDKYLLEFNIRNDGSSHFRSNNRWVVSPSVSAGYNIAKEKFWAPLSDIIQMFKIRGSYGRLANQDTKDWYPTYVTMPVGINNSYWLVNGEQQNTANAPGLVSVDLTWEKVTTKDLGLDISMLRNRLTINFDAYIRNTNDMIGPAPILPNTLGTAPPRMNNTSLRTEGWELNLGWQDKLSSGFAYNVGLALSNDQTVITDYPSTSRGLGDYQYYTGKKIGQIWGLTSLGIAQSTVDMQKHLASLPNGGQDALGTGWDAGDIMYKDITDDGKVSWGDYTEDNPGDYSVIGNSMPKYRFGINLSASFKGWDFGAFLMGVMKMDFAPAPSSPTFYGTGSDMWISQLEVNHVDYFRNDPNHPLGLNMNSYYPRPLFGTDKNMKVQTRYLQNASYLRIKNIQLGYTIPSSLTEKAHISNLRIYVSGENLFTFTKLAKMYDPETVYGGYLGTGYPILKTFSCGLSLNF